MLIPNWSLSADLGTPETAVAPQIADTTAFPVGRSTVDRPLSAVGILLPLPRGRASLTIMSALCSFRRLPLAGGFVSYRRYSRHDVLGAAISEEMNRFGS